VVGPEFSRFAKKSGELADHEMRTSPLRPRESTLSWSHWMRAAALVAATVLVTGLLAASPGEAARRVGSLQVTPDSYVGGQAVTFAGNIGASGVRRITLQTYMNRPGDNWVDLPGFSQNTAANGDFSFVRPAPAMFGIRYRVVSAGGLATTPWTFQAKSQELTLEAGLDPDLLPGVYLPYLEPNTVLAGLPFVVTVDTTPTTLRRRPDVIGLQPIPGRKLTLQRRVTGDRWKTIDTGVVDRFGNGRFIVTEPKRGTVVYRVREEDWTKGANKIGWFPSFPTYINVIGLLSRRSQSAQSTQSTQGTQGTQRAAARDCVAAPAHDVATPNAGATNRWFPSLFDFDWAFGESLTSKPRRGTRKRGTWLDYIDGGGRVNKHNGGLMLDSKRDNSCGPGDFGTTRATLQGNAMTYGRWEVRVRLKSDEVSAKDYRTAVELVPERRADDDCGAHDVTIAEMTPNSRKLRFGVHAKSRAWSGSKAGVLDNNRANVVAVEVARDHITWFLNGKPIGTVASRKAVSGLPMTLRLSMVGGGDSVEMNHTSLISDWQRGFPIDRGRQVTSGKALKRTSYDGSC
jgi:hypothetical protein